MRYVTTEEDEQNNWENRKTRVVRSIRENDFDLFGLNEGSPEIQTYLTDQLSSTYNISWFSPYSSSGAGSGGEAIGIAYKKTYTMSSWHYFWLSDTPSVMTTNDGTKKRGGCCGIFTSPKGNQFFVMVTHGCLDATAREQYAPQFRQMEQQYNPSGYPSFFVGDMNAQPSDPASEIYRQYWSDSYYSNAPKAGPYCTYNAFNLDRNLYTHQNHLDYVYYRNATVVRYVCNDKKYDGYYASDHLPVYADFKIAH